MNHKPFNYEDRLVEFAAQMIRFSKDLPRDIAGAYYADQLISSTGSAALHYGEAQGTTSDRDFIHKLTNVLKELRESRISLKILNQVTYGNPDMGSALLNEASELAAISAKMILNKKKKVRT